MLATAAHDARAVAAAASVGRIAPESWHMLAALLLDDGFDGENLVALACLSSGASAWAVDHLVPRALEEIHGPALGPDDAATIVAGLCAVAQCAPPYGALRMLAEFAPRFDYEPPLMMDAYLLVDYLDIRPVPFPELHEQAATLDAKVRAAAPHVRPEVAAILGRCAG